MPVTVLASILLLLGLLSDSPMPSPGDSIRVAKEQESEPLWLPLDVLSANGLYRGELRRAPGFQDKPAKFSRWRLTIHELARDGEATEFWSAQFPYDGSESIYLLSNDGQTFVHVKENYSQYRDALTILERGERIGAPKGNSFRLSRENTPRTDFGRRWLEEDPLPKGLTWLETPTGPELTLEVHCFGGARRWVSVRRGTVWTDREFEELFRVEVSPGIPERLAELVTTPNVRGFSVPKLVRAGDPLAVSVRGEFVTAGWKFEGFEWTQSGNEGRELVLTPRARRPLNKLVATVLIPFEPTAKIEGLVPGFYSLDVIGENTTSSTAIEFEVLPADLRLLVRSSGLPGREDRELRMLKRGELHIAKDSASELVYLTRGQLAKLEQWIERLPERSQTDLGPTTRTGRTSFFYWRDHQLVEQVRDITTLSANMTELLMQLEAAE